MQNILDLNLEELQKEIQPAFRAKQVYLWLHQRLVLDFSKMTDLSKELREQLKGKFYIKLPKIKQVLKSKDGAKKYLFELEDGKQIEIVLLKDESDRKTVCLSTQVGCPLACTFCATGGMGFKRNLKPSEIIGQVYQIALDNKTDISNLVFMGMGEPFLNYDNTLKAIRMLISKDGPNFGQRKIIISTVGIPESIKKFANEGLQVRLAVSLNAADDQTRSKLMPINRKYPLAVLFDAIKYYINATGRRVTLEYVMLEGINDRRADLENLKKLCAGLSVNVNLIPFNPFGKKFHASPLSTVNFFVKALSSEKINAVARRSRGQDIRAACGQLAGGKQ